MRERGDGLIICSIRRHGQYEIHCASTVRIVQRITTITTAAAAADPD